MVPPNKPSLLQERVNLSPNQVDQVVQLRQDLLEQIYAIVEERRACFANLQVPDTSSNPISSTAFLVKFMSRAFSGLKSCLGP